ncbi:Hypothetical predicted protein [Cloeon dipterum]|uniref:Cuticle protein 6 n=1 Tax=Cloeon dipterum TaxID=197152 RepID=A0A8S1CI95_9INSE|nr:Hypothetical predicted protein [Cloeon dipterum]
MHAALIVFASLAAVVLGLSPSTTPVPILKQINRHNDDGSYSYGYEGADGSFKIETKYTTGEVYGKYGYIDSDGERREIEYGASKRGFEPAGTGINVPPVSVGSSANQVDNSDDYDDGSYREDPRIYNEYEPQYTGNNPNPANRRLAPASTAVFGARPVAAAPAPAPVRAVPQQQPVYQQRVYSAPAAPVAAVNPHAGHNPFYGHPATNLNLNTGSYSISYSG